MKVEIGGGEHPRKGFENIDIRSLKTVDHVCPAWELPFSDNSVDEIYSRHLLEHLTLEKAMDSVKEWYRVLRLRGTVDIIVPDLEYHAKQLTMSGKSDFVDCSNFEHGMAGFYGWRRHEHDRHVWGYTSKSLYRLLVNAGFLGIRAFEKKRACDLRLQAEKSK